MSNSPANEPVTPRRGGRLALWAGLGLCVLAVGLVYIQYGMQRLIVPWYLPALTTAGAGLVLYSVWQRRSVVRVLALGLAVVLAAFQWYFVAELTRLPEYAGPAREGETVPAFSTVLADGSPFTEQDLQNGTPHVMVFFRGRW
jgi:thiamine transporter ThiT